MLCVPIGGRTGVDGVLTVASGADPYRYDADDVVLAEDLASRASISLESGRLLVEAMEAVRARDDFLAVAAHELRTPLTSLMLQVQSVNRTIARDCAESGTAVRGVAAVQTQARRLSMLVDGLLDVVHLASNRMALRFEEVDLRQLVGEVVDAMAVELQRAGCRLTISAPNPVIVRLDRARIGQVLTNLLTNAVKFGSGHPIEVRVDATPSSARISVRDHGPGIALEDQARIFARFERAVSPRHFGGLGLGLYVSAQILRMHQGSVRVESEPGQGACFIVDLPRGPRPPWATAETTSNPSP
jgi:signal transduction histidine kinase